MLFALMTRNAFERRRAGNVQQIVFEAVNRGPRARIPTASLNLFRPEKRKAQFEKTGSLVLLQCISCRVPTYALRLLRRSFSTHTDPAFADSARSPPEHLAEEAESKRNPFDVQQRIFPQRTNTFSQFVSFCHLISFCQLVCGSEITKLVKDYCTHSMTRTLSSREF